MSESQVFVHVDLRGEPVLVGRLWVRVVRGRQSASFEYTREWLQHRERFALEPNLTPGAAPHHTAQGRALFGAIGDSAPDRWGRALIGRAERMAARKEGRTPRTLFEIDYLLGVSDVSRSGALRFAIDEEGPVLGDDDGPGVPPIIELRRLMSAAARFETNEASDEELQLILAPGSSLGGARPKASVRDNRGVLSIAKFQSHADGYDMVRWEAVALQLAEGCGIRVTASRVETVEKQSALIIERFDRHDQQRVPFLSAMSMLGAGDGDTHSYVEIAEAIRQHGASPSADLEQLWRRLAFNILISNTDDHLRNHGFLYSGSHGWVLSPAYDLNPTPTDIKPRELATTVNWDGDATASLELALEVVDSFGLDLATAKGIAREVGRAVADWRAVATDVGLDRNDSDRMATAFEHKDLALAVDG